MARRRHAASGCGLIGPRRRPARAARRTTWPRSRCPSATTGSSSASTQRARPPCSASTARRRTTSTLIGGLWTAQVLALRAAGDRRAGGRGDGPRRTCGRRWRRRRAAGQQCITLHDVGAGAAAGRPAGSPVLVVRDCGMRPPRGRVVSGPWQSVLTLLPYLSPVAPRLLQKLVPGRRAAGLAGRGRADRAHHASAAAGGGGAVHARRTASRCGARSGTGSS